VRNPDAGRYNGSSRLSSAGLSLRHSVPSVLTEIASLGRTLKRRPADVLAHFDRPGTSNGPTEAIS
jgi:transposase